MKTSNLTIASMLDGKRIEPKGEAGIFRMRMDRDYLDEGWIGGDAMNSMTTWTQGEPGARLEEI